VTVAADAAAATAAAAAAAAAAGGQDTSCAMYSKADKALLFGGVHGGCSGSRCQPRQDEW
jgi:hypothetical protein